MMSEKIKDKSSMKASAGATAANGRDLLVGVCGLFDDVNALLHAAEAVRDAGYKKWDCHTPYPVHGLDQVMGLKPSWVPYVTITAGFIGIATAQAMQHWMNGIDYPLVIGGKPLVSLPTSVPITFELFTLFAGISTFIIMLLACRLFRWHSPLHDNDVMREVTGTRFGIVLDAADDRFSEAGAVQLLKHAGCRDVRPLLDIEAFEDDAPQYAHFPKYDLGLDDDFKDDKVGAADLAAADVSGAAQDTGKQARARFGYKK